jgi:hypothetical protein
MYRKHERSFDMLRKAIVILTTVIALSSGFAADAIARGGGGGGGHGGGFGGHAGGGFGGGFNSGFPAGSAVHAGGVGVWMGNSAGGSRSASVGTLFSNHRRVGANLGWWGYGCGYDNYYVNNPNYSWCED